MSILERAIYIATKYHHGQKRKSEDVDYIYHPMCVGVKLLEKGLDNNIVAAAFLHDVVEDTGYGIENIRKEFGEEIANYVEEVTEKDKEENWEERKIRSIEKTKTASLGAKCIVASDKINNLEDIKKQIDLRGKEKAFSKFKRGETQQKWYYKEMYQACINDQDESLDLFVELKQIIEEVFN